MTINFLDVASSKSQLINDSNSDKQVKAIFETINKYCHIVGFGNTLVVTYKPIKDKFGNSGYDLGHFGGIKGMNDFIKHTKFVHVGNNRFDPFVYFIKYLAQKPFVFEQLKKMNESASREFILETTKLNRGLFKNDILNRIMFRSIMADFEQNIFRTAIRNFHNKAEVKVYTFWNCKMFEPLNNLIEDRYKPFGVKFEYLGVPDPVRKMKTGIRKPKDGKKTNPKKILGWYSNQPKGKVFKLSEMLIELNIDNNDFKNAKKNSQIKSLLEKSRTEKQGYYKVA